MAPPSTPDKFPPSSAFIDSLVEIVVGPERSTKTIQVQKAVICFYSGYFDRAFNGAFEEAEKGVVKLPEEDPDISNIFVLWLHTRELGHFVTSPDSNRERDMAFKMLLKLWIFADRREVPLLMNACIDTLRDFIVAKWIYPGVGDMWLVYDNTMSTSGLRRFVSHIVGRLRLKEDADLNWPVEALQDALRVANKYKYNKALRERDVEMMDMCKFHQHEEGVTCSKKRKHEKT